MSLRVEIAPALEIGEIGPGFRRVIPIAGGSFAGPHLRGAVLPGGADWNLTRPDGVVEVWARYTLRADDGTLIGVTNTGLLVLQAEGGFAAHTTPRFEVAGERYAWLRRGLFVGTLVPGERGGAVQLGFYRVT